MVDMQLQKLISHAYRTVPYYRDIFNNYRIDPESIKTPDDLVKLPVLTKEQMQQNPDHFISEDYKYYPKCNEISIRRTSGSTGKFLKIFWSDRDDVRSMFHLWQVRNKEYGINPADRFCAFHTTVYNNNRLTEAPDFMTSRNQRSLSFNKLKMDKGHLHEYYSKIIEFEPEWLFIQPSIAYLLAEYISENDLKIPATIRYIELTGEFLFDNVRQKIEEVFKLRTTNQYGCNEANGIAIECRGRNLHCLKNNVITEVLEDGKPVDFGKSGEIHITCLTNYAMPFIRYALGDRGILYSGAECCCKNRNTILRLSAGRVSEYALINNKQVNCYVFLYPIEKINSQMGNPVNQFQVIQNASNQFTVNMVIKKSFSGWKEAIIKVFIENMAHIGVNNIEWKFNFPDCMYTNPATGKLQFFINEMNAGKEKIYA